MSRTLVLLSGGIDSTVLLAHCLKEREDVGAISFNYGQRHERELMASLWIASNYKVQHTIRFLTGLPTVGCLLDMSQPVPTGAYQPQTMRSTVVPYRNLLMLAMAATWANALGYNTLAIAAHAGDHEVYPDCRPEFLAAARLAIRLANTPPLELHAPFATLKKHEIVERGHALGVPFGLTYSCYAGGQDHCGRCPTCVERRQAFLRADVSDPTPYAFPLTLEDQS